MPIKQCSVDGRSGWKYGNNGKCYIGKGSKEKAEEQGRAIKASQHNAVQQSKKS